MSDEAPTKPKKSLLRRCLPKTAAGTAAAITALVLWLLLLFVWVLRWTNPQLIPASQALTWTQIVWELLLAAAIPAVLYWGLRRWTQVVEGVYPDIDAAWQAGVAALEKQGIALGDKPLFLVLGSSDAAQESSLVGALDSMVCVQGIPDASGMRHALQWYADSEAIYLFCSGASSLSALAARRSPQIIGQARAPLPTEPLAQESTAGTVGRGAGVLKQAAARAAPVTPPAPHMPPAPRAPAAPAVPNPPAGPAAPASPIPGAIPSPPSPVPRPSTDYAMTISADSFTRPAPSPQSSASSSGPAVPRAAKPASASPAPETQAPMGASPRRPFESSSEPIMGTVFAGQTGTTSPSGTPSSGTTGGVPDAKPAPASSVPAATSSSGTTDTQPRSAARGESAPTLQSGRRVALPTTLDTSDQVPRLQYVCRLLKRARRPRCGVNGILTLIPFDLSRQGPLQLSALSQAARGDAHAIQDSLEMRAPITAMLVGLEQDNGFNELVQRLQPELLSRRLGGRFDLRTRPTSSELNVHSDRLCDTFEDWVYRLFGREDALIQQRGNRKLFGLISRIRHELKPRLRIVLGEAFGCENEAATDHSDRATSFFFSGCYFASTGAETGQPAFVKGVLRDKLFEEQSQIEWRTSALRRYHLVRGCVWLGWLLTLVLTCLLVWQWLA